MVDRASAINAEDGSGTVPAQILGEIDLKAVTFAYPTRPKVKVFDSFTLNIPAGRITALVGESGSGKSTVVSLIERFYDATEGQV